LSIFRNIVRSARSAKVTTAAAKSASDAAVN
jgi:hypothetical protein